MPHGRICELYKDTNDPYGKLLSNGREKNEQTQTFENMDRTSDGSADAGAVDDGICR